MTTRNVLFSLLGGGIACLLLAGVGWATVAPAFVSTTGSDTNPPSPTAPSTSHDAQASRSDRHVRLQRLQHWIDDHPVRSGIIKIAATLAVLLSIQLLAPPSTEPSAPSASPPWAR